MRIILLLLFLLVSCGGPSTPKVVNSTCVAGESQGCLCAPRVEGVQTCTAEGVYEACQCGLPDGGLPDGGFPDGGFADTGSADMGGLDAAMSDVGDEPDLTDRDTNTCVPETDSALCGNTECGAISVTDRCGASRSPNCGACSVGVCRQNQCCSPETDAQLCAGDGAVCGSLRTVDNCGQTRNVNCGVCTAGTCDGSNQCVCATDTTYFGQIGGMNAHDGGVPTTGSISGDAGLSQITASTPTTPGTYAFVSITITAATVVATMFGTGGNDVFWLQDGVTVASVRLPFGSNFTNINVGDKVSFEATELQNYEGHPQISAISNLFVGTTNNLVPYRDKTGTAVTMADYGKIVRVGGTLGAGTACGGVSTCYPLTHGGQVTTFRTSSDFAAAGDCVTFIGPVHAFPGPLSAGAVPQLDAINYSWAHTSF